MKKLFDIKRFITLFLTSLLLVMPILSFSNIAYAELTIYDFSDEAQAQFDAEINKTETLKEETPKLGAYAPFFMLSET